MDSEILFFVTPCIQESFFLLLSIGSISVHFVPTFALFNEIVKILHITFSPDTKIYISVQNHNFKIFKTLVSLHPYRVLLLFRRFSNFFLFSPHGASALTPACDGCLWFSNIRPSLTLSARPHPALTLMDRATPEIEAHDRFARLGRACRRKLSPET